MNRPTPQERRRMKRRNISYYLPVMDRNTEEVIGHIVDLSMVGFMMDSKIPISSNAKFDLHLDFMEDIGGRASLDFTALSKWCHQDPIQPYLYNAGFEFFNIPTQDLEVIKSIAEKYGAG
jgi:hypothetical protein